VIERFIEMRPAGVERATVFAAIEPECRMATATLHRHLSGGLAQMTDARALSHKCDELVSQLAELGIPASSRLRTGMAVHLIEEAMAETESDLLVIGASGGVAAQIVGGRRVSVMVISLGG
jgi:hypothetical protein